ncbi:hypothetical protein J2125_003933 [Erwinia toletana]|uniref:Uncharacterized protein n=1 Tax=Winslowiella toletana TaxID=92490 RepID=A0ABS4PF72_9GAMM|nr:hypothetical protein [Winslowiella toletana]MBP2170741.1 hypothetical protein [Winslowiella toletana]
MAKQCGASWYWSLESWQNFPSSVIPARSGDSGHSAYAVITA